MGLEVYPCSVQNHCSQVLRTDRHTAQDKLLRLVLQFIFSFSGPVLSVSSRRMDAAAAVCSLCSSRACGSVLLLGPRSVRGCCMGLEVLPCSVQNHVSMPLSSIHALSGSMSTETYQALTEELQLTEASEGPQGFTGFTERLHADDFERLHSEFLGITTCRGLPTSNGPTRVRRNLTDLLWSLAYSGQGFCSALTSGV